MNNIKFLHIDSVAANQDPVFYRHWEPLNKEHTEFKVENVDTADAEFLLLFTLGEFRYRL